MTETNLAFAGIEEVAGLFRKRKLSPLELTKLILARLDQLNPKLNAYITITHDLALARAKKAEAELFAPRGRKALRDLGPLHGIPVSLKDNICTAGIRTTAGSKILKDFLPQHDARLVTMLKEAGAVIVGKTNLHEFAYGATTNNPHYGPARNPWDTSRIPGGSSGGSAAALCGVVGLKPTLHHVSIDGIIPLSPTLDTAGPLARSVSDAAILLRAIAGPGMFPGGGWSARRVLPKPRKIRLGLPKEFFFDVISKDVRSAFDAALKNLRRLGAQIKEISSPSLNITEDAGNQIAWPEATHYHQQSGWFPKRAADYGEDVRGRLEMGGKISATVYLEGLALRERFIHELSSKMRDAGVDALVAPTTPIAAPLIGEETSRISDKDHPARALLLRLNRPANLAGVPAISIPCSFTASDLPVGLQFIGLHTSELTLLQIAHAYEQAYPQNLRPL